MEIGHLELPRFGRQAVAAPLRSLVRAVLYEPLAEVAQPLLDYAEALAATAQWALAADVYDTVIRLTNAPPLQDLEPFQTIALPNRHGWTAIDTPLARD